MNFSRSIWSWASRLNVSSVSIGNFKEIISRGTCSSFQKPTGLLNTTLLTLQSSRFMSRGLDYRPCNTKRMRKLGRKKRLSTTSGKIVLIRRMMKGVNPRTLTH